MTRNRDDFSLFQALRSAALGGAVILGLMAGLSGLIADNKAAAAARAAAGTVTGAHFVDAPVQVARAS